jgi:glycosyltransferase involved in cell wall biosynthesis
MENQSKNHNHQINQTKSEHTSIYSPNPKIDISDFLSKHKDYRIIIINPGLKSDFGHHLNQNLLIKKYIENDNGDFVVLGNKEIENDIVQNCNAIPTFTYDSWMLVNVGNEENYSTIFKNELELIVDEINIIDKTTKNLYFMFLSDIKYIPIILEISSKYFNPNNSFLLNLFHSYLYFFPDGNSVTTVPDDIKLLFTSTKNLRKILNIFLCAEVEQIADSVHKFMNEKIFLLPLFNIFPFEKYSGDINDKKSPNNNTANKFKAFYPSSSPDRGSDLICRLIQNINKKEKLSLFQFTIRCRDKDYPSMMKYLVGVTDKIKVIKGRLDDDLYYNTYLESDVIIIPYRKYSFRARTSAVFFDSVIMSKPVLATRETWIGEYVDKFKNGETFNDGDIESFYEALQKIQNDYQFYLKNSSQVKSEWLRKNNLSAFIEFFKNIALGKNIPYQSETVLLSDKKIELSLYEKNIIKLNRIIQIKNEDINILENNKLKNIKLLNQKLERDLVFVRGNLNKIRGSIRFRMINKIVITLNKIPFLIWPLRRTLMFLLKVTKKNK